MRSRVVLLLAALLTLSLLPAHAAEVGDMPEPTPTQEPITVETQADDKNIVVNVTIPAVEPTSSPQESETPEVTTAPIPYSVASLDEPTTTGATLSDTVTALFGPYTPRTQTVTDHLADGTSVTYQQIIPGVAGLDWSWLAGVGFFALVLYGLLRMLGGLLKL